VIADANTGVDDAHEESTIDTAATDLHDAFGRAEGGCVVEQLGEQVGDVGNDIAAYP
jgi:hypothetical protein